MMAEFMQIFGRRLPFTPLVICIVLAVIAVIRIVATYPSISLAYDEPAHIVCGMEWLDKGTLRLEPLHPPLPRVAAALGPYLAGARLPEVKMIAEPGGASFDIYPAGVEILYTNGRYARNLALARIGELPFFILGVGLVFLWGRSLYGNSGGVLAVLLYTTLPTVLAFAGIAYVDFALSVFLPWTVFAFVLWLETPSLKRSLLLGTAGGLTVLSNLSGLLFLPICLVVTFLCWVFRKKEIQREAGSRYLARAVIAIAIAAFVIWGGYRFSVAPLKKAFAKPAEDVARLPGPVRPIARAIINLNPPVPAPDLFKGILSSWQQNKKSLPSYALGHVRRGGFWYFYWLDLGLKTPLPFLILALAGFYLILRSPTDWLVLAPAASALATLLVLMSVKVDFGIRHILFVYPFLVVVASTAGVWLWRERTRWPVAAPAFLAVLLVAQIAASLGAHPDYLAYFNVFGGKAPEERLLFGCDLDCGQDVGNLVETVRALGISHLHAQLWTSADMQRLNLPPFETLPIYQRAGGWIAISLLYLRSGQAIFDGSNPDAYAWLNSYRPVKTIGKTIRLYQIPDNGYSNSNQTVSPPEQRSRPPD